MDFINTCYELTFEIRSLAYYAHLLPGSAILLLGFFALRFAQNKTKALLFFGFTLLLSVWLVGNLVTWTSSNYFLVAGFWAPLDFINILFYLAILAFVIIDFSKLNRLPWFVLLFIVASMIFPFLITVAGLAVYEFDEPNCEMYGNDSLAKYKLVLEWIVILTILFAGIMTLFKKWADKIEKKRVIIITLATVSFLGIFSSTEYISTLTDIYEINLYALFTLPLFVLILTYTIIEQGTFKFKVNSIWFVRLLFGIFILVSISDLLLAQTNAQFFVTAAGTIVTLGFGILLLTSAGREAKQREEIEHLAERLEKANKRLKILDQMKSEFVSIASHQLRSPLTSIRGYSSMILEGSFGKIPEKAKKAIERISESSRFMALSVEDYLNVSRIEAGRMKYEMSDFNIKEMAERIVDDVRPTAIKRGLLLTYTSSATTSRCMAHGDIGKTQQIIHNLLDNALKYTKKGTVAVTVTDNKRKKLISVAITDSGVGMDKDTIEDVFEKFVRARNANQVNVTGTGLGLFVARKMAEGMGGSIEVTSPGEGKGSTFTLTMPLA